LYAERSGGELASDGKAVALIDRLTHHAEIIPIEGESYHKREADLTQKKRRGSP